MPKAANQEVTWKSSNEKIATVDQFGNVETHASGEVEIVATSVDNPNVEGKITLVVEVDPIELIKRFNVENPVFTKAKSYLIPTMNDYIYGSVNLFMAADMNLKVNIIPIDKELVNEDGSKEANPYEGLIASREIIEATDLRSIRPGVLKPEIKYITYHDTGNYNVGTGAQNHATYMVGEWNRKVQYLYDGNGNLLRKYGYRSWHYTVDDTEIIQHLPDEEIAFHGDTYEAYTLSIGIETAISQGSNFFTTWHRTAKLIATLLDKHDISIENIEQHHDWSGKDCPQVLRATGLWQTALDMVKAEYLVLTELAGYNIEFISNAPENVTNDGRIVKLETAPKMVSYLVKITNDKGYNETAVLYSTLPAKTI